MNTVSDGQPLGKTIFIDNPFGAAKDIYIWEPIFKLLAVNHVQLIVPARGATPAITSRFDVNYILGQKMADKGSRQLLLTIIVMLKRLNWNTQEWTMNRQALISYSRFTRILYCDKIIRNV